MNDDGVHSRAAGIRFYTLKAAGQAARFRQACTLVDEAFQDGERVLVWLENTAALAKFDDLLWTFSDRAFVPHEPLAAEPATSEAPVQLHAGASLDATSAAAFGTLVQLRDTAPPEALRFRKVIEVVDAEAGSRSAGRERFRYYREQGNLPQHIEIPQDG